MRRLRYFKKDLIGNWDLYLLAIPLVVYYVIFCYGPMYGLKIAFMDYNPWKGMEASVYVGLKHFRNFLSLPTSFQYIANTLRISLCSLIFSYPLPILLALMFNSVPANRYRKAVQTVFYMPHFVSTVLPFSHKSRLISRPLRYIGKLNSIDLKGISDSPLGYI